MTKTKHSIKLTPQQKTAFKAIQNFIISNHDQYLRFSGAAGTGKSTLLSQVLLKLKNEHSNLKVAVASPTNKALKNIWRYSGILKLGLVITKVRIQSLRLLEK